MIWDETLIREEFRRLDKKLGLDGASLPIVFNHAHCTLGQYRHERGFVFSAVYFKDPSFPIEEQLNIIRHEYAHYVNHICFGGRNHDKTWRKSCLLVGAPPIRLFDPQNCRYWREKHRQDQALCRDLAGCGPGTLVLHPAWGLGTVKEASGEGIQRVLRIHFEEAGEKTLSAKWVKQHCETEETQ